MFFLQAEIAFAPTDRFARCHCSTIVECANGDLLVAFYAGTDEALPDVAVVSVREKAGSDKWEPVTIIADTPGKPEGNPVLFVGPTGKVWLFYGTMHGPVRGDGEGVSWGTVDQKYKVSLDNGYTWSEDHMLREEWGYVFRNKPILLANGDIVLGTGCDDGQSRFLISEDMGEHWFYSQGVPGVPNHHPTLIQRSDGSLFALLRPAGVGHSPEAKARIGRTQSFDNGRTWAPATYTDLPNHGAAFDMVKLQDGRLVVVFNNSEVDRSVLTLALSEDEGETWPHMRNLENPPGSYEYPAIIQDRAGLLHVTYSVGPELWNRDHIKHVRVGPEWILGAE
jgi:predicted neuraminidase